MGFQFISGSELRRTIISYYGLFLGDGRRSGTNLMKGAVSSCIRLSSFCALSDPFFLHLPSHTRIRPVLLAHILLMIL